MDTVALGKTGRSTTRLGFGCSSIMGGLGRRESLQILEAAWDAGIRHFDVAPMYGYGEAEACLGQFIERHKGELTVTTKFGIPPAASSFLSSAARSVLRPVVKQLRGLRPAPSPAMAVSFPPTPEPSQPARPPRQIFNAKEAEASLHNSLAALRTDHIDIWLLHEVTAADLNNDQNADLLRFMQDSVQSGLIGAFGAGSERRDIDALLQLHPAYCPTLQYEWSIFNPVPQTSGAFRLHHRSLTANFHALHAALLADRERCTRWSEHVGANLADSHILANLMLKAALLLNPESVILFSSKSPAHITANVALAGDDSLSAAALALYRLIHEAA